MTGAASFRRMLGAARTITRGADELLVYCVGVNCHIPCPVAKRTRSTLAGGLQTSNPRTPPRTESAADDCHDAPASFVAYSRSSRRSVVRPCRAPAAYTRL